MQLVVDTNVLLDGALDPKSPAGHLPQLASIHSFIVCRWALEEAHDVVDRNHAAQYLKQVAIDLVDGFAARLSPLVVDDGGTHLPRSHDLMAALSVARCGADFLVTRNVKDFPHTPVLTSTEVLRRHDAFAWTTEAPWTGYRSKGTAAMEFRCHPGASFGWVIESEGGDRVGLKPQDGTIRVVERSGAMEVHQGAPVPHGRRVVLFARLEGNSAVLNYASPEEPSALIAAGEVRLSGPPAAWKPVLAYGPKHEWTMSLYWIGCSERRLSDARLRDLAKHRTTEIVVSGVSVREVLQTMRVLGVTRQLDIEVVTMALPRSRQPRYISD